jgi:hypothetical protein
MFEEDVRRDDVGKKIMKQNPIRLKQSTLQERDEYMNQDISPEHVEEWEN